MGLRERLRGAHQRGLSLRLLHTGAVCGEKPEEGDGSWLVQSPAGSFHAVWGGPGNAADRFRDPGVDPHPVEVLRDGWDPL